VLEGVLTRMGGGGVVEGVLFDAVAAERMSWAREYISVRSRDVMVM